MTLRAAATILLVLMVLTVLAMRFVPELFYRPPAPAVAAAATASMPAEPELRADIAEASPDDDGSAVDSPAAAATDTSSPAASGPDPFQPTSSPSGPAMPPTELLGQDLEPGSGAAVAAGQTAVVHYTGWLWDADAPDNKGRKFDSSRDHGDTFAFRVGGGQVIRGWDQGVEGMKVGGKRRLVIPPEFGYGERGAGGVIPGGATLVFDVELMGIR